MWAPVIRSNLNYLEIEERRRLLIFLERDGWVLGNNKRAYSPLNHSWAGKLYFSSISSQGHLDIEGLLQRSI